MKRTLAMVLGLLLILTLLTAGCSTQKAAPGNAEPAPKGEPLQLKIATGNTGSAIYALGGGLGQALEKYLPNAKVTVVGSAGYGENAVLLATGQADIATTNAVVAQQALKSKPELYENLRYIATAQQNLEHIIVLAGSNIQSIKDLKGKRVAVGEPGSGTEVVSRTLLGVYGLDYKALQPQYLSFNESVEALQNGTIDAALLTSFLPNPAVMSLATQKNLRFLGMTRDEVMKADEAMHAGLVYGKIPAGTYKGQTEDVYTMATPAPYAVSKDMPEDLVYQITKIFIEHADEVAKVHPSAKEWTLQNALFGVGIPYHPGAIRYYQEVGVWEKRDSRVK